MTAKANIKEKSFYVINLDNRRLVVVGVAFVTLFAGFFAFGYRMGKNRAAAGDPQSLALQSSQLGTGAQLDPLTNQPLGDAGKPSAAAASDTLDLSKSSDLQPAPLDGGLKLGDGAGDSLALNDAPAGKGSKPGKGAKAGAAKASLAADSDSGAGMGSNAGAGSEASDSNSGAATSAPTPAAPAKGVYTIQVGTYPSMKAAQNAKVKLQKKGGVPGYIVKGKKGYFLRSGQASAQSTLKPRLQKIRKTFNPGAWIVKN